MENNIENVTDETKTLVAKPEMEDLMISETMQDGKKYLVRLKLNFIDAKLLVVDGRVLNGPTKLKWMWTKTDKETGEVIKTRLQDAIDWYSRTDKVKEDGTVYGGELISCEVISVRE